MKFSNAAKGVKKIFTAEILTLIASFALVVGVVLVVLGMAAGQVDGDNNLAVAGGSLIGALVLIVVWLVLSVVAFIMNLVGVINASRDEDNFKSALLFLIMGIVASVLSGVFASGNGMLSSLMFTLSSLMEIFVTIFVISGCVKLADRLNRGDVSAKGSNVLKMIIVVKAIEVIASLVSSFMGGMAASVTAGVLALVALVLSIIQYIMYLSFLSKAKKMLAEA